MASNLSEVNGWAAQLTARLKLIQANFAGDSPESRREYVAEEIQRALKNIAPSQRNQYLQALAQRFPSWQPDKVSTASPPTQGMSAPEDTPENLLERFLALSEDLSEETKKGFVVKLREAGFLPSEELGEPSGPTLTASSEAKLKLGLKPEQQLDSDRLINYLHKATESHQALDQLVWTLWRQIAPRCSFRKEADFKKLLGPCLSGDPETSSKMVSQSLEQTRRLISAVLGSIGRAGSTFARQHVRRFAPEAIEDMVRIAGGRSLLVSQEVTCWRKYQELYKEYSTEHAIENEIKEAIVKVTENLIMGRMSG